MCQYNPVTFRENITLSSDKQVEQIVLFNWSRVHSGID